MLPAAAWGAGRALRERELVAEQLAERARELEDEREAHAALSVRYERARIASELHDIVAHAISVMVVQASAGQRLAARDPEATAETFDAIAGAARQAEQDMGRLVALLGDEDAIGPAPDLALVEELVARAAGSGLDVTLRLEGEREGLPAEVGRDRLPGRPGGADERAALRGRRRVAVRVRGDAGRRCSSRSRTGPARRTAGARGRRHRQRPARPARAGRRLRRNARGRPDRATAAGCSAARLPRRVEPAPALIPLG